MPHLLTHSLEADDAVSLTYYELGSGRPPVLLHGYMTPAIPTWVDANIAERLAGDGHRVIMPDLRGHGASVPTNGHAYPPDALTTDLLTLIAQLDLGEYDLGGYSLRRQDRRTRTHPRRSTAACGHRRHRPSPDRPRSSLGSSATSRRAKPARRAPHVYSGPATRTC
jgi:alpha-beta hydrolase superfamily lysophospholipase